MLTCSTPSRRPSSRNLTAGDGRHIELQSGDLAKRVESDGVELSAAVWSTLVDSDRRNTNAANKEARMNNVLRNYS
jgi:hypothetical protein